jgi:hypothetical protein
MKTSPTPPIAPETQETSIETLTAELAASEAKSAAAQSAYDDAAYKDTQQESADRLRESETAQTEADGEVLLARVALADAKWKAKDPEGFAAAMQESAIAAASYDEAYAVYASAQERKSAAGEEIRRGRGD